MKVIFHVVDMDRWNATFVNVRDLLKQYPEAEIEIISMNKAAALFGAYQGYDMSGILGNPRVKFVISKKAMEENNLHENLLPVEVVVEEFAIGRMVKLQQEGYAYIRV